MLLSAGTRARREATRERMRALTTIVDWSRLAEMLRSGRLLPTLGPRILEFADDCANGEFAADVATSLDASRRQSALLQLISARAMDALADAGVRSTALKGPLLGEAIYDEPGRRLSGDIDLLVPQEQLSEAVEVVREMGYAKPTDHAGDDGLPLLHFSLAHEHGELPPVELHWRIHWYEAHFARDRLLPPPDRGFNDWRPTPVDELTALLLFYARDGFTGLRQATDLGAWWDKFGSELRFDELGDSLRTYPELQPALSTAVAMAEKTVGLPADRLIEKMGSLGPRSRVVIRLASPRPYASAEQLYAEIGLIDGLLAPPGGLWAFVRRQIAPPREVIRQHTQRARASATVSHSLRVLGRYGLAFARLLRLPGAMRSRFVP